MPICFLCSGIMLIFIIFNIFNANFFGSKANFSVFLLYITFQIFSFFVKDKVILNVSVVYFVPLVFAVILWLINIKNVNTLKCITISILIATLLIAIGFIDNSFIEFIERNIFVVCFASSIVLNIFSHSTTETILCCILSYAVFIFGLVLKQNMLNLTNVIILNCIMLTLTISLFLTLTKQFFKFFGVRNAKVKKI